MSYLCVIGPQVFLGNLENTVILVCVARPYITESQESLHQDAAVFVQQSYIVCPRQGWKAKNGTEGQTMAIQHSKGIFVWLPTDTAARLLHTCEFLPFVFMLCIHFERQRWHIAIPNLQATVLHSIATHWNRIIFLRDIIYEFRLRISINYTKNVAELLTHA